MTDSSIDNDHVERIIKKYWAWADQQVASSDLEMTTTRKSTISYVAWHAMMYWRRTERYGSEPDLAAAEHYMYARHLASWSGDPLIKYALSWFAGKKKSYYCRGMQMKMAMAEFPELPGNSEIESWGTKGAEAGLSDYQADNPDKELNTGASVPCMLQDLGDSEDLGSYPRYQWEARSYVQKSVPRPEP